MHKIILYLFTCSVLLAASCDGDDSNASEDAVCYSFDERQCGADPFTNNGSIAEKAKAAKAYLLSNGIELLELKIDENFHEAVCEACNVCPEVYRFFIKIESDDDTNDEDIKNLNLFNLSSETCDAVF